MPRGARKISQTGIYHIMLRGIDKRNIFLRTDDYKKFIEYILRAKEIIEFKLYAYCLMPNHVHLLLQIDSDNLGDAIKRITVGYAQYHNIHYGRTGHLFQNRYRSEAVETDSYFLTVLRYIHQNPVKATIVKNIQDYQWSSYKEYLDSEPVITDPIFVLSYFENMKSFISFIEEKNDDVCLEYDEKKRWLDGELKEYISTITGKMTVSELDARTKQEMITQIRMETGASNRQLSKVLNIGRGILNRMK